MGSGHPSTTTSEHPREVSIQLVSPASGEKTSIRLQWPKHGFPVSIQLVSPASGEPVVTEPEVAAPEGFHSISFPSEWGDIATFTPHRYTHTHVSIQLVSPASGELSRQQVFLSQPKEGPMEVSIQLVSPASGETAGLKVTISYTAAVSIQLVSPASGEQARLDNPQDGDYAFPFN